MQHVLESLCIVVITARRALFRFAQGQGFEASTCRALYLRGRVVAAQRLKRAAQHAHDPIGALGVAAEPEQVVGHAALDDTLRSLHARGLDGRLPQAAVRGHLAVGNDPNVPRARFGSGEGHGKIGDDGHGEAAGHHGESVSRGGDEQPDGERLGNEPLRGESRRGAEPDALLGNEHLAVQLDLVLQRMPLGIRQAGAELPVLCAAWSPCAFLRRPDHHAIEIVDDVAPIRHLAQPAAGGVGNDQILCKQLAADGRQVGAEATVLRHRRTERIAHELRGLAAGLHQPRRPAVARRVELEGVRLPAIDAAHDEIDALEALQRF